MKFIKYIFSKDLKVFLLIVLIGLLVRLILVPLTAHGDTWCALYSQYYWIHFGLFKINQLPEVFQGLYLKVINAPILHSALSILFDNTPYGNTQGLDGATQANLAANPLAMRVIFFYKLPYFLFDLGSLVLLLKIFKKRSNRILITVFWAFNPLILHSVYMWGRYEIFSIFFVLWSFYYAKNHKVFWSIFMFGLAIAFRMPYVLVLPLLIIYLSKNWKDGLKYTILALLPLVIVNKLLSIYGPDTSTYYKSFGFFEYFMTSHIYGAYANIAVNFFAYMAIIWLYVIEKKRGLNFNKLVYFSLIVFLTIFSFSYFHPQYAAWLTPFLLMAMILNRRTIIPSIISLILLYLLINGGMGETTGFGLFKPSSDIISQLPKLTLLPFEASMNNMMIYNSFIATNVIIMIILYKGKDRKDNED